MNENTIRNEVDCPRVPGLAEMLRDPGGFVRYVCECRQYGRPFYIRTFTSKFLQYYGIMADIQNK